ncbi:hypothetical protein ES676_08125 [Bizionia saleffrena]|uniref:7(1) septoil knot domain-containing protein n=1 Tax=Bizionia saleffrena TaxID=291189 RepID=A0A8H2LD15_9FLAO|nr:DUF6150 family protein [Bizionia saleffrena]TYB74141.1 hypothetical protein ES676_08125 [Bizionia saleffrena]
MRHYLFLILLLILVPTVYSQEVFITDEASQADFVIYITEDTSDADWVILKTDWKHQAMEGKWFFTDWQNDADLVLCITADKFKADKIVFYTQWSTAIIFEWKED